MGIEQKLTEEKKDSFKAGIPAIAGIILGSTSMINLFDYISNDYYFGDIKGALVYDTALPFLTALGLICYSIYQAKKYNKKYNQNDNI